MTSHLPFFAYPFHLPFSHLPFYLPFLASFFHLPFFGYPFWLPFFTYLFHEPSESTKPAMSSSPSLSSSSIFIASDNPLGLAEITLDELTYVLCDPEMRTLIAHNFNDNQTEMVVLRWIISIGASLDRHQAKVQQLLKRERICLRIWKLKLFFCKKSERTCHYSLWTMNGNGPLSHSNPITTSFRLQPINFCLSRTPWNAWINHSAPFSSRELSLVRVSPDISHERWWKPCCDFN